MFPNEFVYVWADILTSSSLTVIILMILITVDPLTLAIH